MEHILLRRRWHRLSVWKFPIVSLCLAGFLLIMNTPLRSQWIVNGMPISVQGEDQDRIRVVSDNSGGAYIVWRDGRTGDFLNNGFLYGQHVTSNGTRLWQTDGMHLHTGKGSLEHDVIPDGNSSFYMSWKDDRLSAPGLYIQRVNQNGPVWADSGVFVREKSFLGRLCGSSDGGVHLVWSDGNASGIYPDIYGQKYDENGNPMWTTPGVVVCKDSFSTFGPQAALDGANGIFVLFAKDSVSYSTSNGNKINLFAQRIGADGSMLWDSAGIPVCLAPGKQDFPILWSNNNGYAYAAWNDYRSGKSHIYAQKWDSDGNMLWQQNGKPISTPTAGTGLWGLVSDGTGGVIIVEESDNIFGTRINSSGDIVWNKVLCTNSPSKTSITSVASKGNGGFVLAWQDYRYDMGDIYAQSVNADGDLLWNPVGVALCKYSSQQRYVSICYDGNGGIIGAWEDQRPGSWMIDVYAAKINGSGIPVPVEIVSFGGRQEENIVVLTWRTVMEENNHGFFVDRQQAGVWNEIGFVPGAGRSTTEKWYEYRDEDAASQSGGGETRVSYRLRQMDFDGTQSVSGTVEIRFLPNPESISLSQNYPNPFGNMATGTIATNVEFAVPPRYREAFWTLKVYDALGREAGTLFEGIASAPRQVIRFDGRSLAPGNYRYVLSSAHARICKTMTIYR